jgi:aryl-alcohol dehydrogenase-like predicted oxidoreductase
METAKLGNTGLEVTRLGLGLAEIQRQERSSEVAQAARVLTAALDAGINFLDTAACYGTTEELIGRTVAHRRDEYILATKCGHATGEAGGQPWTSETIEESIDRSLIRMRTDYVDILQLHSCDVAVLERGEVVEALVKAKDSGKTRFLGYSGDNQAARWAVDSGLFDTLQTSFNLLDQHPRTELFKRADARGMGIIVKRPVANGAWHRERSPYSYADEYFRRAHVMAEMGPVPGAPEDPILLAMGFVFAHPEVDTAIVGTHNPSHVLSNIEMVERRLPIPEEAVKELYCRFDQVGERWPQLT